MRGLGNVVVWSAGASGHSRLSGAKAFFGRPLWPSENDHGDA